jgi:hypothetical protein
LAAVHSFGKQYEGQNSFFMLISPELIALF